MPSCFIGNLFVYHLQHFQKPSIVFRSANRHSNALIAMQFIPSKTRYDSPICHLKLSKEKIEGEAKLDIIDVQLI